MAAKKKSIRRLSQKPQARWSRMKKRQGKCARCGALREHYAQLCDFHQGQQTAYMRRYRAERTARAKEQAL